MQCILFGDRRLDRDPGSSELEHHRRRFCPRWLHSYLSQRQPFKRVDVFELVWNISNILKILPPLPALLLISMSTL